ERAAIGGLVAASRHAYHRGAMRTRRERLIVMGLVLGLAVQLAYVVPAHATALVRALTCCAAPGPPVSPAQSGRRCRILRQGDDPAVRPLDRHDTAAPEHVTTAVVTAPPAITAALGVVPGVLPVHRFGAGPPRYLEIRTLRL